MNSHLSTVMHSILPIGDPVKTGRQPILGPNPKFGKHCAKSMHKSTNHCFAKKFKKAFNKLTLCRPFNIHCSSGHKTVLTPP